MVFLALGWFLSLTGLKPHMAMRPVLSHLVGEDALIVVLFHDAPANRFARASTFAMSGTVRIDW